MPRSTLLLLCGLLAAAAARAEHSEPAPQPPPLPADSSGAALHAALPPEAREKVDERDLVVTFAEEIRREDGLVMRAVSLGTLRHPPEIVKGLLANVSEYPKWVTLAPSYKTVRITGRSTMIAGTGSSRSDKAKRELTYDVSTAGDVTTWRLRADGTPMGDGSFLSYEVLPHPSLEGATLVVHRQVVVPEKPRLGKYLASDDDKGRNRYWKDANKHARRLHWAMDAALRHPPGAERRALYAEHFQREFPGHLPWWAE